MAQARRRTKSGAERIGEILDDPIPDLTADMTKLGKSFFGTKANRTAVPGKSTFQGIRAVRGHYQGMGRRISKIDTGRTSAKRDVLDALKRFDSALAAYAKALPNELTPEGAATLRTASSDARRAALDLEEARSDLK